MGKILVGIISWAMTNLASRVLASIGFAILGTVSFNKFIEYFINKALNQFAHIPMIGLVGIAGIDTAISIVISSVMIKLYLSTVIQSLKLVPKK